MRSVFLLAFAASFLASPAQSLTGDSWEKVNAEKKGTIWLASVETPAIAYRDAYGNLSGISVDIMNDFVRYVDSTRNVALEVKTLAVGTDFKSVYDSIRNSSGGVFGLGSITITEERKKEVRFGPAYISNFAILITQDQVPMLTRLEDLPKKFTGFTAYSPKGTLNEKRITGLKLVYFPGLKITSTATGLESLEKIMADAHGFAYLDFVFYLQAIQEGKAVRRHPAGDQQAEQYGFAMPLNSDWSPLLEEFFSANGGYRNTPHYKTILVRHLGETGVRLLHSVK